MCFLRPAATPGNSLLQGCSQPSSRAHRSSCMCEMKWLETVGWKVVGDEQQQWQCIHWESWWHKTRLHHHTSLQATRPAGPSGSLAGAQVPKHLIRPTAPASAHKRLPLHSSPLEGPLALLRLHTHTSQTQEDWTHWTFLFTARDRHSVWPAVPCQPPDTASGELEPPRRESRSSAARGRPGHRLLTANR